MAWVLAPYLPVSFFSLRPSTATASGGTTLLVPTAFAIKMALLSASLHTKGLDEGQRRFPTIRALRIALSLPEQLLVLKTVGRVQRPSKLVGSGDREPEVAQARAQGHFPYLPTMAPREYVQFAGPITLACTLDHEEPPGWVEEVLVAVNYLGKRGGFLQIIDWPKREGEVGPDFIEVTRDSSDFPIDGTLQQLDDWGETITFEHADIYSEKPIVLGKERLLRQVVLPYRLEQSGRTYSRYRRIPIERDQRHG